MLKTNRSYMYVRTSVVLNMYVRTSVVLHMYVGTSVVLS